MEKRKDIFINQSQFPKGNPFDVPQGYFESLEDRIGARIEDEVAFKSPGQKVIQMLKPILGLAASFAIAFLLIYYPLGKFIPKFMAKSDTQTEESLFELEFIENTLFIDENTLLQTLSATETSTEFESDEIINLLSSELNDYQIYAEIIN